LFAPNTARQTVAAHRVDQLGREHDWFMLLGGIAAITLLVSRQVRKRR
jgi:hypothetical protein